MSPGPTAERPSYKDGVSMFDSALATDLRLAFGASARRREDAARVLAAGRLQSLPADVLEGLGRAFQDAARAETSAMSAYCGYLHASSEYATGVRRRVAEI